MESDEIKVGFCVAYDWYFLENSLPLIYNDADIICLSVDKQRVSWAGQPFVFDEEAFYKLITRIDVNNKVTILEDDFHKKELSPMQNEVRQRTMMADFLGTGGWHIQIDSDEYFIDFKSFVQELKSFRGRLDSNICVPWVTLFKSIGEKWLVVEAEKPLLLEYIPVATRRPIYEYGRGNGYFNYKFNHILLHQSWARTNKEIRQKVENWGHKNDFDINSFFTIWESLDEFNFTEYKDFHPLKPHLWHRLKLISGNNVSDIIESIQEHPPVLLSKRELKSQNSVLFSRLNKMLKPFRLKI